MTHGVPHIPSDPTKRNVVPTPSPEELATAATDLTRLVNRLDELSDNELSALLDAEEDLCPVIDTFALVVTFSQARAGGSNPEFASYDEARDAGIELLQNHADALSFKIDKRTSLKK